MIIVTGAAGFIGSVVTGTLNQNGYKDLWLVDKFEKVNKLRNLQNKEFALKTDRDFFFSNPALDKVQVSAVIHLGARTDTTENDRSIFKKLNTGFSKKMWAFCSERQIPLITASSAAVYGNGEFGYCDDHELTFKLNPLNPYAESKLEFDRYALETDKQPSRWYNLRFFNVYGPNEYHKGKMASVVWHTFLKINKLGYAELFKSYHSNFAHGRQLRDFIYVKDVAKVIHFLLLNDLPSGIYNLGTGVARTFEDLATSTFRALNLRPDIRFVEMPENLRDRYQYFTEADMSKLRKAGYKEPSHSLEKGILDYVTLYLSPDVCF